MTAAGRADAWSAAPVALLRLDGAGRVLDANGTFLAWLCGRVPGRRTPPGPGRDQSDESSQDDPADLAAVRGVPLSTLFTVGGRIYWDTYVAPAIVLAGLVDDVSLELRTSVGPLPVLLTARRRARGAPTAAAPDHTAADGEIDVAMFAAQGRAEFQQELVRARSATEHWAERLRWVQEATAALSRAAGAGPVRDALLAAVARHPAVADVTLRPPPSDGRAVASPEDGLTVPVAGAGGPYGHLVVHLHGRPGDSPLDGDALAMIAQQGAVALDRARLAEESVSVAHELQRAMLAVDLPVRPDLEVGARYRPAAGGLEVGGDWYDVFHLDDTTLAVVVGDVVGHGLASATAMGQLRTATRALARPGLGPAGVLDAIDRFVLGYEVGFGSTLAYAELDVTTATLTYASAGHLPPLRLSRDAAPEYLWDGRSTPLGVHRVHAPPAVRTQGLVRLDAGDVVLLYTDGVVERRDRSLQDGLDELATLAHRHARLPDLAARLVDLSTNHRDDACMLSLRWHGQPPPG